VSLSVRVSMLFLCFCVSLSVFFLHVYVFSADQASGSDTDMKTAPPALLKIPKLCLGSARMCAVVYL